MRFEEEIDIDVEEYLNEASTESLLYELERRQELNSYYEQVLNYIKEKTNNPYLFKRFICDYLEVGYHIHTNKELAKMLKNKLK